MNRKEVYEWIESDSLNKDTLLEEQFDNAIIGHNCEKIIYDVDKMSKILEAKGMNDKEIDSYLEENCFSKNNDVIYMMPYNRKNVENYLWLKNILHK